MRNVSISLGKKLRHNEIRHVHIIFANHIYIYKHMIYDRDFAGSASFCLPCDGSKAAEGEYMRLYVCEYILSSFYYVSFWYIVYCEMGSVFLMN